MHLHAEGEYCGRPEGIPVPARNRNEVIAAQQGDGASFTSCPGIVCMYLWGELILRHRSSSRRHFSPPCLKELAVAHGFSFG